VILLAVTNSMTNDVAAMPLLWVLPLVLYLLTFILAFDARRWYRRGVVAGVLLPVALGAVCAVLLGIDSKLTIGGRVALLAAAMFVCCLVCHGELAALKPPARGLTAFYLSIAAGGAAGRRWWRSWRRWCLTGTSSCTWGCGRARRWRWWRRWGAAEE
jgi:hypothetical protein